MSAEDLVKRKSASSSGTSDAAARPGWLADRVPLNLDGWAAQIFGSVSEGGFL